MSGSTGGLDLRYPIGALFSVIGVIVGGYGLATNGDATMYAKSMGVNVNLWWGIVMLVFGVLLLLGARRGRPTVRPAVTTPEGEATEEREKSLALER